VFVPLGIFFVFIALYLLASTADIYLSPSLDTVVTKFRIPDSLAGVTLLAFGNGAPDVFSAIAAAQSDDKSGNVPNATKSMSVIFGGTMFITSLVTMAATRVSNLNTDPDGPPDRRIQVTPRYFIRDVIFLMIATIYNLVIFLFVGYFDIYTSVGLLLLYVVYVIIVVIMSKRRDQELDSEQLAANLFNEMVAAEKLNRHK
jgi:sodium/potassium/calcium exchanger 6